MEAYLASQPRQLQIDLSQAPSGPRKINLANLQTFVRGKQASVARDVWAPALFDYTTDLDNDDDAQCFAMLDYLFE